jgi:hypothetical protein
MIGLSHKHDDDLGAFCDGPFGYVQLLLSTNTCNSYKGVSMLASSWILVRSCQVIRLDFRVFDRGFRFFSIIIRILLKDQLILKNDFKLELRVLPRF